MLFIKIFIVYLLIFMTIVLLSSFSIDVNNIDYIIILGNALEDNKPSKILKYRLDHSFKYINEFNNCKVIVSGGITSNNTKSEAEIMKNYLINEGVDSRRIILEDKAKTTEENFIYSKKLIKENKNILVISSSYHILRSRLIAEINNLKNVKYKGCYTPIFNFIKHIFIEIVFVNKELIKLFKIKFI